jgi:TonB-dependent receptor
MSVRDLATASLAVVMMMAALPGIAQEATGSLAGTVSGPEGGPVPGARLTIVGTRLETATDRLGRYRLARVPAGDQKLAVTFVGFADQTVDVTVEAGASTSLDVTMELESFTGSVTVTGDPILAGQAQALNEQKVAPNIVNVISSEQIQFFPDTNAAEATQRVPGLFIQRDQGEGRYVLIRGTAADLNLTQIDGETIPAPEGDVRQVALDVIPTDVLETMRVSKALTADQDADAIGGIVNLEFRDAPSRQFLNASLGGYYGDLRDGDGVQAGVSWGNRFSDDAIGVVLSASYTDITRNTENFEADGYDDGSPEEFETRDYNVNRERLGLVGAFDWRATPSSVYRIKGIFNEFSDQEYRRRVVSVIEDGEIERELKDRYEVQQIWNAYFEGENVFPGGSMVSYKLSYAHAEEDEPNSYYPVAKVEDIEFDQAWDGGWFYPNPLNEDTGDYLVDEVTHESGFTEEDTIVARVDFQQPFATGLWKLGAKVRDGEKSRDVTVNVYEPEDDLPFSDFIDPSHWQGPIVRDHYISGPNFAPGAAQTIIALPGIEHELDLEEELADYSAEERIYAGYGLAEIYLGDSVMLMPGLRYEYTDGSYSAYEFDEDEETLTPVSGDKTYGELLPNFHVKWAIDEATNLRAAVTRSMSRPNYEQVVPTTLIVQEDREIERGNADLDPTTAWNLDLMFERYFTTVGIVSAGLFYKDMQDYIFIATVEEERDGEIWDVTQPLNGDAASLWGLEVAYQNQFRRAPSPWDGFGVYVNFTWTDSEATLPGRGGDSPLPGQPDQVGNIALSYEKGFFSGILSFNYQGEWLEAVGDDPSEDEWVDEHTQLDFQAEFRIGKRWSIFTQLYNLTDEPYRRYIGNPEQPLQQEYYSWWGLLGAKFSL